MSYRRLLSITLFVLSFALIGCNRDRVDSVERNEETGGIDVTITIAEEELDAIVIGVIQEDSTPILLDPVVDLQPGLITITGRDPDQNDRRASIVLTATAQNGAILFQAVEVNLSNIAAREAQLVNINNRMASRFARRADPENRVINFTNVTITDSGATITLNARRTR